MKKQVLAADIGPHRKQYPQSQNHEFDPPAHRPHRRPVGALKVHQHKDGSNQKENIEKRAARPQVEHPMISIFCLPNGNN